MSIDDEVAVIGSSNMDMRSFGLNLEISCSCAARTSCPSCAPSRTNTGR